MPAYKSHAIIGHELYKLSSKEGTLFRSKVNEDSIKTYSLGIDLAFKDIHSIKTQEFLMNLMQYIKENNLIENEEVLALLYGHICHYFFDTNAHPFIYYIEKGCQKVGVLGSHTLVEGYLDCFMSKTILHKECRDVRADFFNQADFSNDGVIHLIKNVYFKTYNFKNALRYYKMTLKLMTMLETSIRVVPKASLINLFSFEEFLVINHLTREEIVNKDRNAWQIPLTGEIHYESFLELYNRALEMTMYAIEKVNGYLYDGKSLSTLIELFPNISYDTGVDISLGYTFPYTRKNK